MSNITMLIYVAVLFVLLTPGILLRLPPKGSPLVVAIVHAVVFALIFHLTHKMVWRMSMGMSIDGFKTCPQGKKDVSGNCV
jgi:uncharacterized membrane-anchored protein